VAVQVVRRDVENGGDGRAKGFDGLELEPAARARNPAARSIASARRVVVDFPFVPVIAMMGTERAR
jgi:hypothetical protein